MARNVQVEFPPNDSIQIELGREDPIEVKDELRVHLRNVVAQPAYPSSPRKGPARILPIGSMMTLPPAILIPSPSEPSDPGVT